jgi:hypothetical protein
MSPCSDCGCKWRCTCFDEPETDGDPELEAWLANCDREEAAKAAGVNEGLAPRKAA